MADVTLQRESLLQPLTEAALMDVCYTSSTITRLDKGPLSTKTYTALLDPAATFYGIVRGELILFRKLLLVGIHMD